MMKRKPAVAGFFYPENSEELLHSVDSYLKVDTNPGPAKVAILPHAGYIYSGSTAGAVLGNVQVPNRVILLGPKHRHLGLRGAIAAADFWGFPFGDVQIDHELAEAIVAETDLERDDLAHRDEHSLEVEIPFLWRRNPEIRITPIALGIHRPEELQAIGEALANVISDLKDPVLIAASTDMSHQIPIEEAARLDDLAIQRMLSLDAEGLYETVFDNEISMCGVIPVTAALFAAQAMGATEAKLIKYTTSAEATGDTSRVVGYAGIVVR